MTAAACWFILAMVWVILAVIVRNQTGRIALVLVALWSFAALLGTLVSSHEPSLQDLLR